LAQTGRDRILARLDDPAGQLPGKGVDAVAELVDEHESAVGGEREDVDPAGGVDDHELALGAANRVGVGLSTHIKDAGGGERTGGPLGPTGGRRHGFKKKASQQKRWEAGEKRCDPTAGRAEGGEGRRTAIISWAA